MSESRPRADVQSRAARIQSVVDDCLSQRAAGRGVSDESLIAAHPGLMPELSLELRKLRQIEIALAAAQSRANDAAPRPSLSLHQGASTFSQAAALRVRCPFCSHSVQLGKDHTGANITCPQCAGCFSLLNEPIDSDDTGHTVVGDFELLQRLGSGGFGTVWKARDRRLDRIVALKLPRHLIGLEGRTQFVREAQAAAQLRHPNIVSIYEIGRVNDIIYIASEYIEGTTLAEWLFDHRMPPRTIARFCAKIADALEHAHRAGIVHRDLKPSNILLDQGHDPHIADFGMAKRQAPEITVTMDGKALGTPAFMSPEQAAGQSSRVDARSDIYALGVILFELLTGELPFRGNPTMLMQQVLHDEPPSPRKLAANIPRDLETICLKAMAKSPGARYQTAADLADDLRRFDDGRPITARPSTRLERAWAWAKRRPISAALLVVSFIALLAAGGLVAGWFYSARLAGALATAESERTKAQQAQSRLESVQYFHYIHRAHSGWQNGDLIKFAQWLDACPPGQRNWEWRYLQRLTQGELLIMKGHAEVPWEVLYSPDGKLIASAGQDGVIKLWDADTGALRHDLRGATNPVNWGIAFNSDGSLLASTNDDGTVRLWDVKTGNLLPNGVLTGFPVGTTCVSFSPDGKHLVCGGWHPAIFVWDLETRAIVHKLEDLASGRTGIMRVLFSPDGHQVIASTRDHFLQFWDFDRKSLLRRSAGHTGIIQGLAITRDGKHLVSGSADQTVRVWDAATGQLVRTMHEHAATIFKVAVSRDGSRIASASVDQTVRIWNTQTGECMNKIRGHTAGIMGVDFSPDGRRVITSGGDFAIRVWDKTLQQECRLIQAGQGEVQGIACSSDDKLLASAGSDGTVKLWNLSTGEYRQTIKAHDGQVNAVAFSADSRLLATAGDDKLVRIWDVPTQTTIFTFDKHRQPEHPNGDERQGEVTSLAFSRDGRRILSSALFDDYRLWDPATGQTIGRFSGHVGSRKGAALSPDQKLVATPNVFDVEIHEVATQQRLFHLQGHTFAVFDLEFSPDSRILASASGDSTIRLWDSQTGKLLNILRGHNAPVTAICFSPDRTRMASGSLDHTVRLWDLAGGDEVVTLRGHGQIINGIVFSRDGNLLISASADGTIRIWDARPNGGIPSR